MRTLRGICLALSFCISGTEVDANSPLSPGSVSSYQSLGHNQVPHRPLSQVEKLAGKDASLDESSSIEEIGEEVSNKDTESFSNPNDSDGEVVGVKSKKSNAVGDPDDDSDDDDADDDLSDWEGVREETPQPLKVEVELLEQGIDHHEPASSSRGGIGIKLAGRKKNRRMKPSTSTLPLVANSWMPHIFLPPSALSLVHLQDNARQVDAAGKVRLDRRTLYFALLMEFCGTSVSRRRFFSKETAQQLQAAVSLATQPQWRSAFPQASGIVLYDPEDEKTGPTLSMQETIAMALVSDVHARLYFTLHLSYG